MEQTIILKPEEFELLAQLPGKKLRKLRYLYNYQGLTAEFDIFLDNLAGLVVIEFEFKSSEDKAKFGMPDFCLADVTQNDFIAGGMLCGKNFEELSPYLEKYHYQKLFLN